MSVKTKKSWTEKLQDSKDLPKLETIPARMQKKYGKGTMIIPSPKDVNGIMKKIPKGKVITINGIRRKLAEKSKSTIACPMTTGIFAWIAAQAAEEEKQAGKENITPYWRTLKEGGIINEKYPGGIKEQVKRLEEEGHHIIQKRGKWVVTDWQQSFTR